MTAMKPLSFPQGPTIAEANKGDFPFSSALTVERQPSAPGPVDSASRMKQLEQMLHEVQGRAEIVEKEAYDKAYLAGEKAGMALGKKRAEQILQTLEASLRGVEASLSSIEHNFSEAALDIAQHIAEQIVGSEIEQDHSKLLEIALQAAAQLPDTSELCIAVSHDDFTSFKRLLDDSDSIAVLTSDSATASGTCRIVSAQQDILIDPIAAVAGYLDQLSPGMLKETTDNDEEISERSDDEQSAQN